MIGVLGFIAFRFLIGGSTVTWNQRLTDIINIPAGQVRGTSLVNISKSETMGSAFVS